ncbi:hypothetical protein T492DRAFT_538473 [Pavlovales sp. CCMP2436]|nr:hypothetical protein T492DRAFT_538473 [Pavlovales sp. CCMP2436]
MRAQFSAVAGLARPGLAPGHASAFSAAGSQRLSRAKLPTLLATAPASAWRLRSQSKSLLTMSTANWPPKLLQYLPDVVPKEVVIELLEEMHVNAEEITNQVLKTTQQGLEDARRGIIDVREKADLGIAMAKKATQELAMKLANYQAQLEPRIMIDILYEEMLALGLGIDDATHNQIPKMTMLCKNVVEDNKLTARAQAALEDLNGTKSIKVNTHALSFFFIIVLLTSPDLQPEGVRA